MNKPTHPGFKLSPSVIIIGILVLIIICMALNRQPTADNSNTLMPDRFGAVANDVAPQNFGPTQT
jgi:hypothetical protein